MAFTLAQQSSIMYLKDRVHHCVEETMQVWDGMQNANTLKQFIRDKTVVTGGISASLFHNSPVNDIDCYMDAATLDEMEQASAYLRVDFIESSGIFRHFVKSINPSYMIGEVEGKCITANAITLIGDIQIIRLASADVSRKLFDFIHCQPVYDWKNYRISEAQYASIRDRVLVKNPAVEMVSSRRVSKFMERGWSASQIQPSEIKTTMSASQLKSTLIK